MKKTLLSLLLVAACQETIQHQPDAAIDAPPDMAHLDGMATAPSLTCTPTTAPEQDLCACMANIVCDQIYFCLTPAQLAAKPSYWSPKTTCVDSLVTDCNEDMASDPSSLLPTDFRKCIADLGSASCSSFNTFSSVSNDFPPSCDNLRALDTGLGISQ